MLNSLLFLKQVWRTIITEKWQYKLHSIFPKGLFRTLPPIMSCTWPMSIVVMVKLSDFFFAGISPSFNCSLCYCYSSDAHFDTQYPVEPSCDARRIRAYGSDRFALRVCRVNRIWRPFGPPSARLCRAFIKICLPMILLLHRNIGTWGHRNMGTWWHSDMGTLGHRDMGTW